MVALVFTYQAVRTALALREARSESAQLKDDLRSGDAEGAVESMRGIAAASRTAHEHSENILWDATAKVPWLGHNIEAVQVVAEVLDTTSASALPSAVKLSSALTGDRLRSEEGRFDLDVIGRLSPQFDGVAEPLRTADHDLGGVDPHGLVSPVRRLTVGLTGEVQDLRSTVEAGAAVTRLMPSMLGADGPRQYLLVVQNNAEIRSTGGLPGSLSILRANNGRLELTSQRSGLDFHIFRRPVLPLSAGERALYGKNLGVDVRDTNLTPDFPRSAALMSAMLEKTHGQRVDGVLSVDPVALSEVLRAIGPTKVDGETFGSGNVVSKLLNLAYERFDNQELQNAYFSTAARGIFEAFTSGHVNQQVAVRKLAKVASQRRLLVWSRHGDEQKYIDGTAISGELPNDTGDVPNVGMYLNDGTAGKIEYFLDYTGSLESLGCSREGVQRLESGMVLSSSVPHDVGRLSRWVTGFGEYAPKGSMRMTMRVYAPTGGKVTSLSANGARIKFVTVEHDGRRVAVVPMLIRPGEEVRLSASIQTRAGQRQDPVLQWTPGMRSQASGKTAASACA